MPHTDERRVAVEAVEMASRLCQQVQANLVAQASMDKRDKSPVTVADCGAQAVVTHGLRGAFPEIPLVGAEDAAALREPANRALAEQVVAHVGEAVPGLGSDIRRNLSERIF